MIKLALVNITKDMECPPLNLVYLATFLEKNMKDRIKIKIIDINFEDPLKSILSFNPDVIGLSSMTVKYNYARKIGIALKKYTKAPIIIGGVHISTCNSSFDRKAFDIATIGESERTLLELMQLFEKECSFPVKQLESIDGLLFYRDEKIIKTRPRELIANLDELPIPDRRHLNKEYFNQKGEIIEAGLLTSRGCCYRCVFCSTSLFWNHIRFHSPERVAREIEYLIYDFKVNYIVMYDDFFAISEERANLIYKEMRKRNLVGKVKIVCSLRANAVTDKLCRILKKIGVITINFGFESGSDKILQYLKADSVTVEQNKKAVLLCRKNGLDVKGSFILGSPHETIEDMKKTIELMTWMKEQGAIELWCGVAKPYPSTQLWNYGIENGLIKPTFNWDYVNPSYVHNPVFLDKSISKKEFFRIFKEAKCLSLAMVGKENKLIRNIKDAVYYNKFLYDMFKRVA